MSNDWIEHNGGPQPVTDDVWVELDDGVEGPYTDLAGKWGWEHERYNYRIVNQHLIDAARLEGIRLGLEAAARLAEEESGNLSTTGRVLQSFGSRSSTTVLFTDKGVGSAIRALNPDTIAKEADNEPR